MIQPAYKSEQSVASPASAQLHWSASYIGLTWQDVGPELCWGLVRKIMAERARISVPSYEIAHGGRSDDMATIAALLRGEAAAWPWHEVTVGDERELDVVIFRQGGIESHVGIVVGMGRVIHLARGFDARVESFCTGRLRTRLAGIYRHQYLIG